MRRLIFSLLLIILNVAPTAWGGWRPLARVAEQKFLSPSAMVEGGISRVGEWIWWQWRDDAKSVLPKVSQRTPLRVQDFLGILQEPETDWAFQGEELLLRRGALWLWMPEREWQIKLDSIVCRWPRGVKGRVLFAPERGRVEIFVSSGELVFPCFDFDEELTVVAGQGAFFQGAEARLRVEKLPSGRRIPLGEIGLLPEKDVKAAQGAFASAWEAVNKARALQKKEEVERKKRQGLCHAPEAQFGQCMERLEKGVCKLYRCTAQGEWAYAYTVTGITKGESECSPQGKIVPCR